MSKEKTSFDLDFILKATDGKLISEHQKSFSGIATDTRKNMNNELFIALKGDAFDAHRFLSQAIQQQAAALVVHDLSEVTQAMQGQVTIIKVSDTLLALQNLATAYRKKNKALIVGIAGSNGKTTSKEFCAALLSAEKKVHYSKGSFNNHWGVPFTLLSQPQDAQIAVVEMGMNHANELARLAKIAQPDIVVCTYVGIEHIEHFGSLEKIAEAEAEIYFHSPEKALRIFNLDNSYTKKMWQSCQQQFKQSQTLTFSQNETADVMLQVKSATMEKLTIEGKIAEVSGFATVGVFGHHNVTNLMVAASVGLACGLSAEQIWKALPRCQTTWGRNQLLNTEKGSQVLFDGYNSNPDSMKALAQNMSVVKTKGKKIGIFAEMKELGDHSALMHEQTGKVMAMAGFDLIWFYGPHAADFARGVNSANFKGSLLTHLDFDEVTSLQIAESLGNNDIAVVKGSRGMKLERFVRATKPLHFDEK